MEELIAKRYVKALRQVASLDEIKEIHSYMEALAELFRDWKIKEVLISPEVSKEQKLSFLLEPLKGANEKLVNFLKLLAQKDRLNVIPAIAKELKDLIAFEEKRFEGRVYSEYTLEPKDIQKIQEALAKKVGAEVILKQAPQKFDGIKVEVDTIGIEIEFSKSKIKKQLIENILKAI